MHGRPRKASRPEDEAASIAKAEKLRSLQSQFLLNHHNKLYTKEAIELSAKLLEINPEAYTAWNYRKLAVEDKLCRAESDPSLVKSILDEELIVVESALRQNFKSYGAWHHRKWVLSKGHSFVGNEMRLLDKFQRLDARNFHAWNYRRFVVGLMNRSEQEELNYTDYMINNNFSNYSAWHNRSVLLSGLLEKKVEGFVPKEKIPEEYEFVHQAIFTDPDDQSGWFYHLWLVDQTVNAGSPVLASSWPTHGSVISLSGASCLDRSSSLFNPSCSDSGSFPLILYFNQAVSGVNSSTVMIESDLVGNKDIVLEPLSSKSSRVSRVWVAHLNHCTSEPRSSTEYKVKVRIGSSPGIVSFRGSSFSVPYEIVFTVHVDSAKADPAEGPQVDKVSWMGDCFSSWPKNDQSCGGTEGTKDFYGLASLDQLNISTDHDPTDFEWRREAIVKEIDCFRDLLSLEDSKIGKLTLARLLMAHEAMISKNSDKVTHFEEVLHLYKDLMKSDSSHFQYYKDEHSVVFLRQVILFSESLSRHLFRYKDSNNIVCLRLNNLSLSRLGSIEKLLFVQMLDLSYNELRSAKGLEAMQLLSCLNLSHNKIQSFSALDSLRHLKQLKVLDISHNQIGEHSVDTTRYLCSSPLSHSVEQEWTHEDGSLGAKYWDAFFVLRGMNLRQLDAAGNVIAGKEFRSFVLKVLPKLVWFDGEKVK